jgi:hypothetical protein
MFHVKHPSWMSIPEEGFSPQLPLPVRVVLVRKYPFVAHQCRGSSVRLHSKMWYVDQKPTDGRKHLKSGVYLQAVQRF